MSKEFDITDPRVLLGTLYAILKCYNIEHRKDSLGMDAKEIENILRKAQQQPDFWPKWNSLFKESNQ